MVQARPNRARLTGTIENIAVTADCPTGWSEMRLHVDRCDDVDDLANMLQTTVGTSVTVLVARDALDRASIAEHDVVSIDARKVSPRRIVGDGSTLTTITT